MDEQNAQTEEVFASLPAAEEEEDDEVDKLSLQSSYSNRARPIRRGEMP